MMRPASGGLRWIMEEKRAVVAEALSSGNVIATAKRNGIQVQQIYRWRKRLGKQQSPVYGLRGNRVVPMVKEAGFYRQRAHVYRWRARQCDSLDARRKL